MESNHAYAAYPCQFLIPLNPSGREKSKLHISMKKS